MKHIRSFLHSLGLVLTYPVIILISVISVAYYMVKRQPVNYEAIYSFMTDKEKIIDAVSFIGWVVFVCLVIDYPIIFKIVVVAIVVISLVIFSVPYLLAYIKMGGSYAHESMQQAIRDFVDSPENKNPYEPGSPQHATYNVTFDQLVQKVERAMVDEIIEAGEMDFNQLGQNRNTWEKDFIGYYAYEKGYNRAKLNNLQPNSKEPIKE